MKLGKSISIDTHREIWWPISTLTTELVSDSVFLLDSTFPVWNAIVWTIYEQIII